MTLLGPMKTTLLLVLTLVAPLSLDMLGLTMLLHDILNIMLELRV